MEINFKTKILFLLFFIVTLSCESIDYQKIKIENYKKTIYCISNEYIIDSVSFELNNELVFSTSLIDKKTGSSQVELNNLSNQYKVHKDYNFDKCDELVGLVFVRKKGNTNPITKEILNQKKDYKDIQQFFINLYPCKNTINEFDALRRLK